MRKPEVVKPERFETCAGLSRRAFTVLPDTKFNTDGLFKISLVVDLSEPSAQAFKEKVDAAALEVFNAEIPERDRGGWEHYLPYERELSPETGERTGRVVFAFKRNAKIKLLRTGEVVDLTVAVFDSEGAHALPPPIIGDNSLVRVWGEFRPIRISAARKAGVRMDFSAVKVLRLERPISPFSPDSVDGGWRNRA